MITEFRLDGKVALVTGASRGIGQAIAETYAAVGAKVVISSRRQDALDDVAVKIREMGGDVLPLAAHTGDEAAITRLVKGAMDAYGGIDILVNNAATNPHFGPLLSADESYWDKTFDVNVKGYFRMVRACMESFRQQGSGKVINMASVAGAAYQPGMGIYCITKAGVIMLTKALAVELAGENVQVNAIAPGFVKTSFSRVLWENAETYKRVVNHIPQRRMATPDEIAGIALYLASEASSFTTGEVFYIDGGQMAGIGMLV